MERPHNSYAPDTGHRPATEEDLEAAYNKAVWSTVGHHEDFHGMTRKQAVDETMRILGPQATEEQQASFAATAQAHLERITRT